MKTTTSKVRKIRRNRGLNKQGQPIKMPALQNFSAELVDIYTAKMGKKWMKKHWGKTLYYTLRQHHFTNFNGIAQTFNYSGPVQLSFGFEV